MGWGEERVSDLLLLQILVSETCSLLRMMTSGRERKRPLKPLLTSQRSMKDMWLLEGVQTSLRKAGMIFSLSCSGEMLDEAELEGLVGAAWGSAAGRLGHLSSLQCGNSSPSRSILELLSTQLSPARISSQPASPKKHEQAQPRSAGPPSPSQSQPASSRP